MPVSQQGLDELTALVAVYGTEVLAGSSAELRAALQLAAEGHAEEASAILDASGGSDVSCNLRVPCSTTREEHSTPVASVGSHGLHAMQLPSSNLSAVPTQHPWARVSSLHMPISDHFTSDDGSTTELALNIPSTYPHAPISISIHSATVAPNRSISSQGTPTAGGGTASVSRACLDALNEQLQELSNGQGVPGHACCLHELLEHATQHLEPELHRLLSSMQAAASAATSAGAHGTDAGSDLGVALVKLDHLHNRPLYVKTLSNWAKELCLTGRFMFHGFHILILMEGPACGVHEYLVRHRTLTVDIDSRGRQCKERMATVIAEEAHPLGQRACKGFRDVDCGSWGEVEGLLTAAGMSKHIRAAAGLPPA